MMTATPTWLPASLHCLHRSNKGVQRVIRRRLLGPSNWLSSRIAEHHASPPSMKTHTDDTVSFQGATSEAFPVSSDVKQRCVLVSTLFWIFFSLPFQYAFSDCDEPGFTSTQEQMASSSTLPIFTPKRRSSVSSSVNFSSPMMQPLDVSL